MRIAILGGGNMGQAMVTAFLKKKVCRPADLLVVGRNAEKLKWFAAKKIRIIETIHELSLQKCDVIFLAVKPQDMAALLESVRDFIPAKALVISIMTGIALQRLGALLPGRKIVRCVPNTPAQIQQGVTGWSANRAVTSSDKKKVKKLLDSMGQSIYFSDEKKLNAVTAVSGSGPAYVFYFMEAMIEGAKWCGLSESEARELVLQTFIGASHLAGGSKESPAELRAKVTSKKGTTAAAIDHLDKYKVSRLVAEAVQKARDRARELSL